MKKPTLKPLVEIRSSGHNSISFQQMDFEGGVALMLTAEDGGGSTSFFFADANELITFSKRVIEAAEAFLE